MTRMQRLMALLPHAAWHGLKVGLFVGLIGIPALALLHFSGLSLSNPYAITALLIFYITAATAFSVWEAQRSGFMRRER